MNHNQVFILSDAIRTGKTTALHKWVKNASNIVGFLSPDVDEKRMFQNIKTGDLMPMETEHQDLVVGKYAFDSKSFCHVENTILEAWETATSNYIVLDEIGPLEINKSLGFHNLLIRLQAETPSDQPNLLLVVRNSCLDDFLKKYNFKNVKVLTLSQFKNNFNY